MQFSLANFIKYKGPSILLLLLVIIISLLLSDIPWLVKFIHGKKSSQEGMTTDNSIPTIEKILSDKMGTKSQKLAAIKGIVDLMDNGKDQMQYLNILEDGSKNENEKIEKINELVEKYMNSTTKATKDMTSDLKSGMAQANSG